MIDRKATHYEERRNDETFRLNITVEGRHELKVSASSTQSCHYRQFNKDGIWIARSTIRTHAIDAKATSFNFMAPIIALHEDLSKRKLKSDERLITEIEWLKRKSSGTGGWSDKTATFTLLTRKTKIHSTPDHATVVAGTRFESTALDAIQRVFNLRLLTPEPYWSLRPRGHVDLVLAPTVSSMALHELICHPAEESRFELGSVIGPKNLTIYAFYPSSFAHDAEGISTRPQCLVKNGRIGVQLHDRTSQLLYGLEPSGLAQVSSHSDFMLLRCSHISVCAGRDSISKLIGEVRSGVICFAASRAELQGDEAVIWITLARTIHNGRLGLWLKPFPLNLSIADLHRVDGISRKSIWTDPGWCVKFGDAVYSQGVCPFIRLRGLLLN